MCVIVTKAKGLDLPNKDAITAMWDANSDGAGFMYTLNNRVHISKGFMTLDELLTSLAGTDKKLQDDFQTSLKELPVVMHFRIGTHGSKTAPNTHPFPISSKDKYLKALDVTCDIGMVHNGVISIKTTGDISDTMQYIKDYATPLAVLNNRFHKVPAGQAILEETIGYSKLAFLDSEGDITTIGTFLKGTKNGTTNLMFSNLNHEYTYNLSGYRGGYYNATEYETTYETFPVQLKRLPDNTVGVNVQGHPIALNSMPKALYTYYVDEYGYVYSGYAGDSDKKTKVMKVYESAHLLGAYYKLSDYKEKKDNITARDIEGEIIDAIATSYTTRKIANNCDDCV